MNKKEILEIRKLLAKENTRINRISCCYVDGHKEKKTVFTQSFYSVHEEAMFKYSDIFKKTLSGTIGKNLHTLEFPLDEEMNGEKHELLSELVKSELNNDSLNESFFDKIIEKYSYPENYLIILAHGVYDIPSKSTDNTEIFDASEYVYKFMVCSVCPVNLSKPGLCYDAESGSFIEHLQDWMVQMPDTGFLYPAFNDRNTDIHSLLFYTKNADEPHAEFTEDILGCYPPVAAKEQKLGFNALVEEVFGSECDFNTVKEIHENLNIIAEEKKEEPEPPALEKNDIKKILSNCGADEKQLEVIDNNFDTEAGKTEKVMMSTLGNLKKFEVESPDIKIRVSSDRIDLIDTMMIEGQEYIVIPLTDEVRVNGLLVRHSRKEDKGEDE
ncbi:MAG: DUF4317 domain-containing protein [Candidatus Alectryocaccobium sp.]|jgi:hypothetical protein|nr:DUF4317 domain-containing protein [Candidatus Alectryocaccobium sp.]